jgi:hypothetical protein
LKIHETDGSIDKNLEKLGGCKMTSRFEELPKCLKPNVLKLKGKVLFDQQENNILEQFLKLSVPDSKKRGQINEKLDYLPMVVYYPNHNESQESFTEFIWINKNDGAMNCKADING